MRQVGITGESSTRATRWGAEKSSSEDLRDDLNMGDKKGTRDGCNVGWRVRRGQMESRFAEWERECDAVLGPDPADECKVEAELLRRVK